MDEKNRYYSYQVDRDEFLNNTADIPAVMEIKNDKGFLDKHPWLVSGGLLAGLGAFCFMATWGTIEWIAHATAKKITKKMGGSR